MNSIGIAKIDNILQALSRKQATLLIGIDGCGGSGKSTLARELADAFSNVTIVKMDDFYLPSLLRKDKEFIPGQIGSTFDWQRLKAQVLIPLSQNLYAKYQRYDWDSDSLAEWRIVSPGNVVIVEGVYSTRRELADFYDLRIWVACPREIRLARGLARDGESMRDRWEREWMPLEDIYVQRHRPDETADLVVSGYVG
jgi:uridine kinase